MCIEFNVFLNVIETKIADTEVIRDLTSLEFDLVLREQFVLIDLKEE